MSSNNTTYNTSFDQTRSPINSSHLGPPAGSLTPGTFRTNVNRAKSKRWVEAKTVDYGGGGWGDDGDFDDEDDYNYGPPPMGGKGSGLQRSNSFDRGDDVMSPVIGNRGNGSAVPRIETTDVGITQPLPPTPLELEQRERALRGKSPPPHPKHQYPMQPKPQLSALPYMTSATPSPARTPPLPVYGGASGMQAGSPTDPGRLPDLPVKDRIPPPLGVSPHTSAIPSPSPPPPSFPLQKISALGRDAVPPPLGMGPGSSPVLQPYANFAPFTQSLGSAEKPLPIRKDSPPNLGDEIARANPSLHLTSSPSPPSVPQKESEHPQYPPQWGQASGRGPPPPPPAKPLVTPNQEVMADSSGNSRTLFDSEGGVKLDDDQNDFQVGHVDAHQGQHPSYSPPPPREAAYSPPNVPPPPQSASPEPARPFVRPAEIMAQMDQTKEKGVVEESRQGGILNMSSPDSITSMSSAAGPNNMGRQSTDSLPPPGIKSPERIRELRESLGRPGSRQSNSEDSRPGSSSGSRPNSRNSSRPSSRQGRATPSPYPPPTGALPTVPGSPAVPVAQHFQHPMDAVVTGQDNIAREEQAMSWNDDIISGYTDSPEEAGVSQHTNTPYPPLPTGGNKASAGPVYPTNHSAPDPEKSRSVQGPGMESVRFKSMVDHAFTRQDTLVSTPISPHRGNLNSSPGDMISPILPRDIPLPKSPSPPIINTPAPPSKPLSPPTVGAPILPPKSPSPPILSNPAPRPKSLTPPGPAATLENSALALSVGSSRSSSPTSSMGPERSVTPIVPPAMPDGVEVELDQVTPDTAGPQNHEAEKSKVSDTWASASGLDISLQPVGHSGASIASSPEKDDLDRFLGELVRANTPAPRSQTTSPRPPSNRASMDNANQSVPPVPAVPEHPSPPQQFVDPVPQSHFQHPNSNRESVGLLSLYDSYWADESVPPPPIQPKNPRRPSAALEAEAAKQELEILTQTSGSSSEQRPSLPQPVPSHPTVEPPTPDKKSGVALPPVRIPENNFHGDSSLATPASVMETPDSELVEMMIARKHYLARTQTGLSIRSDGTGRRISDDVMLRVKGDEMMLDKPNDIVTPDAKFEGMANEVIIGSEVESAMQDERDQRDSKMEEAEVAAPARVIGPDSEGMEAIGGPTRVPRPESSEGEADAEKTPMQSDFARELVNQFSRPQTLMLKDTMPMPSGVLVMPPMPPKEEGEEVAPEVVDFSTKDDDEELVISETGTIELGKSLTQGSTPSGVHLDQHSPKDIEKMSQYLHLRDIARLTEPRDRIAACNQATRAIAESETGLSGWVSWMMEENGGEELLKIQVEQRPETAIQGLKKSTSRAFMGVGRPSVDDSPNQPSQQHQHQRVTPPPHNAGWAPQSQGPHGGEDDPRADTAPQAPGASGGQHVSPVVDKARGFFNRLKKGNSKEGQDGALLGVQSSQKGHQYAPSTAGSLRTLASSGSFQNSFTASGLVGATPSNGNHKQGSQGRVTPPQSVPHQGQHQGHPQDLNRYPQGPQGVHAPPQGLPQDPTLSPPQGPHPHQVGLPRPPIPQGAQPLLQQHQQQQGYQQRPQQQEQEYGQFNNEGQFQQGSMGPSPQRAHPQPDFTERFSQAQSPLPPPPVKDQPPQLAIPILRQQMISEEHPVMQGQPPQDASAQASLSQTLGQTARDRLPAGNGSTPHSRGDEETINHSQSPLTVSPPVGHSGQSTYPSPSTSQHPFPKRTDSLLSRARGQGPAVNSPVTAQTPGRADSLTFVHDRLPPLQQPSTRSDSLVSSIYPSVYAGRSDSITSSVMNSPTHPARSDSLNFAHNGHPPQQNSGWAGGPQGASTNQGPPQYQNGPPPTMRAVGAEDPNTMSRSFSDRVPNHPDSYDHAGVARSQSYHVGAHTPNPNEVHQQQRFMHNRPRGPPEPIQENPQSPGRPDDDLYAPPARLRQQPLPTQYDQRGKGAQQRPQQPFDDIRERPYAAGLGPAPQPGTQGYPLQGPQGLSMPKTGPEPQQSSEQSRLPGHQNQGPNPTPPQGYQGREPYQEHGPTPQGQYQPGFQPRAAGYQTAQPPQQQQPPPQGQFRQVSPSAMGAPGSLLRQHGQPQAQPEPEPGLKRNSTSLVKTLSNVSGKRQSTDAGSFDFQGRSSQGQYEPSTSSSQGKRRSNLFGSLSAKVEKAGRESPSEKQDPKPVEKAQRRGTSFLKLKSKESKDKRSSGDGTGKPTHKKGFSIDVFGRTGSMLGKLSKSPGPSPKQQQQQQRPPLQQQQQQKQGAPQKFPQQQGPPPQHRQSQPVSPRPGVGPQGQSPYPSANAYYNPQQQPPPRQQRPQQPQGPPGQLDGPQEQLAHPQGPAGQASPPQIKTLEPVSQSPPDQQQPLPKPNSQEPRYDPVPIPTGYGRPQGEFYIAHNSGQSGFAHQQLRPPQSQFQPSRSLEPSQGSPVPPGQQSYSQEHSDRGGDMHRNSQGREHRLSVDYRHSPDLSHRGSGTHGTPPPPSLSPQPSRQGTQASHTRSTSPQISNVDAHSIRNAHMSSVSENPTGAASVSSAQDPPPSSEGDRLTTGYVSPPHISPQSSVRGSNRYASPPPSQASHTPPPQLAYPVASPLGLQQAMNEMEYKITRRSPTTQPMAPPPVPSKQPATPPPASSSPAISQAVKPSSPAPLAGSSISVGNPRSSSPPPTAAPTDMGKATGTFYAEDSTSSSSKAGTPTRAVFPEQPVRNNIPEVDFSQEKIALQDGVEVEPPARGDSDDVPVMSATAYPGQEWDPGYYGW